jgi:hypothetical protein
MSFHRQGHARPPLFPLGQVVATPGALAAMAASGVSPEGLLTRHVTGDWGDVCSDDKSANEQAVKQRRRILSAYTLKSPGASGVARGTTRIWILTEADRSCTTLLLPEEY